MDNQATESSTPQSLSTDQAAALFANMLEAPAPAEQAEDDKAKPAEAAAQDAEPAAQDDASNSEETDDPTVTVKIDGKDVEVKLSELKNGYQRQADYTRKTQEVADQRRQTTAEQDAARQERAQYADNLRRMQAQLEGVLQEQQQTDWQKLIDSDPVEYLKQQHLWQQRQAAYQQNLAQQQQLAAVMQAEQQQAHQAHLQAQQQALLAKLPEWSDPAKATADKAAIRAYLLEQGYDENAVSSVADARAVLMARKAMLYDQMLKKADVAARKVAQLPTRIERPGTGDVQPLDKRSSAFQRLSKSGRVEDAAAVFSALL